MTSLACRQNWSHFIIPGTADRGEGHIAVEEKVLRISIPVRYSQKLAMRNLIINTYFAKCLST